MEKSKSNLKKEKTVVQEYLENEEIKRTISQKIQETINNLPKETYQQLLDAFDNDKLALYSTIQIFSDHYIENMDTIISVLTYDKYHFPLAEQLMLATFIEFNILPEDAKKGFIDMQLPNQRVDELTTAFSDLKYGRKNNKSSPSHYIGDFPGDFRDL